MVSRAHGADGLMVKGIDDVDGAAYGSWYLWYLRANKRPKKIAWEGDNIHKIHRHRNY